MARTRRGSSVLETARQRLAGIKSITPAPNLGTALANYEQVITAFVAALDAYNQLLAALDEKQNSLDANEDLLKDLNKRVLAAIGAQYGTDSSEYEMCAVALVRANGNAPAADRPQGARHQPPNAAPVGRRPVGQAFLPVPFKRKPARKQGLSLGSLSHTFSGGHCPPEIR